MRTPRKHWARGMATLEIASVVAVVALLMALGFMAYRSVRLAAQVATAQSDLKQVATAMELYFRQYGSYPPQGCDLAEKLGPFVSSPEVFRNPLMEEETPGQTISVLYRAPTADELDRPNRYLTAMVASNGHTSVILRTGQQVERRDDIPFNPNDPRDFHASLNTSGDFAIATPPPDSPPDAPTSPPQPPTPPQPGQSVRGTLNINPRNNEEFEFSISVPDPSAPGGLRVITRDDLLNANGVRNFYAGQAVQIRVCPKGNGNQNGLIVDGQGYSVRNGTLYLISLIAGNPDSSVTVRLYNTNSNGKAMGKWWIDITANHVTITTGL